MARKVNDAIAIAIKEMNNVLGCITDSKKKKWSDLWQVAFEFCNKNYSFAKQVSDEWGVAPMYLLLTALLYVEHPLLVGDGRAWKYNLVVMQVEILKAELNRWDLAIPFQSTEVINTHVDNFVQPVDKIGQ